MLKDKAESNKTFGFFLIAIITLLKLSFLKPLEVLGGVEK